MQMAESRAPNPADWAARAVDAAMTGAAAKLGDVRVSMYKQKLAAMKSADEAHALLVLSKRALMVRHLLHSCMRLTRSEG